jgi:arsenate reductase
MAEAIWREAGAGQWRASSAGSRPTGAVHPLALEAIDELGLPVEGLESKHVDQFLSEPIDLAVTVCDNALEACPSLPNAKERLHWPFDDPADATGTDQEIMNCFRRVREEIREKIKGYLS